MQERKRLTLKLCQELKPGARHLWQEDWASHTWQGCLPLREARPSPPAPPLHNSPWKQRGLAHRQQLIGWGGG